RNRASSSASVRYRSSLQVMIFVIRFLLFVARPRRSGPFLRPGCDDRQGKACRRRLKRLNQEKRGEGIAGAGCGITPGGARGNWYGREDLSEGAPGLVHGGARDCEACQEESPTSRGDRSPVSRPGAVVSGCEGVPVRCVSGRAPRGGPPPPVCPHADLRR